MVPAIRRVVSTAAPWLTTRRRARACSFRLDPDRTVHRVLGPVTISNGLAWSADGDVAFYVDSPTQRIDALSFDPDAGTFSGRRPVVHIPADVGMPDGLTLDAEGGIWVALWSGAAVHRYSAAGSLECVIDLPVRQPTSCTRWVLARARRAVHHHIRP